MRTMPIDGRGGRSERQGDRRRRKVRDSRVTTIHPTAHSARDRRFRRKPIFITRACFCEEFRLRPYLEMDAAFGRFR